MRDAIRKVYIPDRRTIFKSVTAYIGNFNGKTELSQRCASRECVIFNGYQVFGKADIHQRGASLEGAPSNVRHSITHRHRGKGGTILECLRADGFQGITHVDLSQSTAIAEGTSLQNRHGIRDRNRHKPGTAFKRGYAHRLQVLGENDLRKAGASYERGLPNRQQLIREGEPGKSGTAFKRLIRKFSHPLGKLYPFQGYTILEHGFTAEGNAIRDVYLSQGSTITESK